MGNLFLRVTSLLAVGGGVLLPSVGVRVFAEGIYRWTGSSGRPCYSNVGPPVGISDFTTTVIRPPPEDNAPPPLSRNDGPSEAQDFLKQRIADRQEDIRRLEALLKIHPGDASLRRNLMRKKQYLGEDLLRLSLLRPREN